MTPHLRIEPGTDALWLTAGVVRFDAEGTEHGRSWCARLPPPP